MSIVKINSYVDAVTSTEEEALTKAMALVNGYDNVNNSMDSDNVITKLYYVTPVLGKILVVVNDEDRDELGVSDNVLSNVNISEYPLERLPSTIVDYKELIVKLGSSLTDTQILDAAQAIADETALTALPYKMPIVKIINYNTTDIGKLVIPSMFNAGVFTSVSGVVNNGDSEAGQDVLDGNIDIDLTIETKIIASDGKAGDYFGLSVAVSDSRIVISARNEDTNGTDAGAAYIFDLDGNQLHKLLASDGVAGDYFGGSVAVSNSYIIVGAHGDDANGNDAGAAYVFDLDGNQLHKLLASDGEAGDYFGNSVAIFNSRVVVGARGEDTSASDAGAAYIFDLDGNQLAKIQASDGRSSDYFGWSVAISDSRIVVGSINEDSAASDAGAAYVFDLDGNELYKIQASDAEANDRFGRSVAISDSRIVVGAYDEDSNGTDAGAAYIFDLDGNQLAKITASDGQAGDWFGTNVAISNNHIVVSAHTNDTNGSNSGAAYVFDLDGNEITKLLASDGEANDLFGNSVAASDSCIVVGAPYESTVGDKAGSAYIYG